MRVDTDSREVTAISFEPYFLILVNSQRDGFAPVDVYSFLK